MGLLVSMALSCPCTAQDSRLERIDGVALQGRIQGIDNEFVTLESKEGPIKVPVSEVGVVQFGNNPVETAGKLQLFLVDGSRIYLDALQGKGNEWLAATSMVTFESKLSTKLLRSLLFKKLDESQQEGWNEAINDPSQNDGLVVARPGGEITRVGGSILELKNSQVFFEFDDQRIEMPVERLLGMLWYQADAPRLENAVEIRTVDQSIWRSNDFRFANGRLTLKTVAGVLVGFEASKIADIRYASANVRWISELESLESTVTNSKTWKFKVGAAKNAFLPRFVSAVVGKSLPSDQDLLFSQPGTFSFRMPEGFRRFEARVQRPDTGELRSPVVIQVWQDSEKVFEGEIPSNQEFLDVKATLAAEKRIRLVVTSSGAMNLGTEVQWKQPRLLR
jgi:hypothetical protein